MKPCRVQLQGPSCQTRFVCASSAPRTAATSSVSLVDFASTNAFFSLAVRALLPVSNTMHTPKWALPRKVSEAWQSSCSG